MERNVRWYTLIRACAVTETTWRLNSRNETINQIIQFQDINNLRVAIMRMETVTPEVCDWLESILIEKRKVKKEKLVINWWLPFGRAAGFLVWTRAVALLT